MAAADREDVLAAFLLGVLPEAEHEALEERLLAGDEALHEGLDLARDDLIHAYLAGRLAPPEREAFEKHFLLSARHRERLAFVRDLKAATARVAAGAMPRPARRARPWSGMFWPIAAALLIALAAIAAVLSVRNGGGSGQVAVGPSPSPSASASPSPRGSPPAPRDGALVVRLRSGAREVTELQVGARTGTVRLLVPVEPAPGYAAILSDARGREAWRSDDLTLQARGEPLAVSVPAEVFADGDYVLSVHAEALRSASPAAVVRRLRVVRADR